MNRTQLQNLSRQRRKEARALLDRNLYSGAYYLIGYAVECGLKACIAKQTARFDFPNKLIAQRAHTHDIEKLVGLAGLDEELKVGMKANRTFETNWLVVKDWTEGSRYDTAITREQAQDMYSACVARKHGVLAWIGQQW